MKKLPTSVYNWVSLIGATIALITLFMIIFLFAIVTFTGRGGSYLGLVIYIILPAFLITGLILIPIGMFIRIRKERKQKVKEELQWPQINLNDIRHRNAFLIFAIGTTIFLFLSAVGSYEAYHYSESVQFCGTTCHSVMKPEYTAYQHSPHARVACVECHVGEGADWFIKSKISGLYQVYAVTLGTVPRPIQTPITSLRPARETCENCHWPEQFYAQEMRTEVHYLNDTSNTEWRINLNMKVGAEHSALGLAEGIHWHINPNIKIEYIASDRTRENIPWVRYTNKKTGRIVIYEDQNEPLTKGQKDSLEVRTMDCIDCHNRPSHNYKPPAFFVNSAMTAGDIPKDLPGIKNLSMEICAKEFSTSDSAVQYIKNEIESYYKENYPDIYSSKRSLIRKAISGLQNNYVKNIFPEMNVRWDAYPNHIGHLEFKGCFRCHNDNHMAEDGRKISKDCNQCHTIQAQGPAGNMEFATAGNPLEFRHPDGDESWKEMLCVDCHTGLNP